MSEIAPYEFVIKPRRGWIPINLQELWEYRELLYFLVWRNIKVKYKQSVLGVAWVILKPTLGMLIFTLLFGKLAGFPSEGMPYPVFVFSGLILWTYFSSTLTEASLSLVSGSNLISKIYFPRVFLPFSNAISNFVDFLISFSLLLLMLVYYGIYPSIWVLSIPLIFMIILMTTLGFSLFFGALNVRFRDVGHIVPFLVQIWMFVTPVIYPMSFIPEKYRAFFYINPVSGPLEAFRAALLGNNQVNMQAIAMSLVVSLCVFILGLFYFKRVELTFADVI